MSKPRKMTHFQAVLLGEELKKHCKTVDGMAVYDEGYDDRKVAALVDANMSHLSVAGLRRAMFGDLKMGRPGEPNIKELLKRIEALEAWAATRPVQPFKRNVNGA